ncbi:hypothetical protein [Metabacillus herbersteinensis]|uniref:hypothetical protein n=1 Tax=Metabacillus herbersteinensis TaxID=283816 RepID=UPI0036706F66
MLLTKLVLTLYPSVHLYLFILTTAYEKWVITYLSNAIQFFKLRVYITFFLKYQYLPSNFLFNYSATLVEDEIALLLLKVVE